MGCVYNRGTKSRPNWWIRWVAADGKFQFKGIGDNHELARSVLKKIEADTVAEKFGLIDRNAPKGQDKSLAELAEPWVQKRLQSHRSARDDIWRMRKHLVPFFGRMRLAEIDVAAVKKYIESKRQEIGPSTISLTLKLLSRFFNEMREEGFAAINPVSLLDRHTRHSIGPKHDPRKTPFLKNKSDIRAVFMHLPEPVNIAFAVGALAGLRTGEVLALQWEDVDLENRRIHVKRSFRGPLKDNESRIVPVLDSLRPILTEWHLHTGGSGLLFPPRQQKNAHYMRSNTLHYYLKNALSECGLPVSLTWYQCTRHTFASHWVMDGRSIELLKEILGHSTILVTERYAHLVPGRFRDEDYAAIGVDLGKSEVVAFTPQEEEKQKDGSYTRVTVAVASARRLSVTP